MQRNQHAPGSPRLWYALDLETESGAHEAVEYALMEAGALGTETNDSGGKSRVTGYFDALPDREDVRTKLAEALQIYELQSSVVAGMNLREVEDQDWLGEWKKNWQPVETGRFIVAPPWADIEKRDRIVIRIEPGMAFGTGTHETTRLCLRAIEKYFEGGSFLDVGTGTGILAIAAAKLFPHAHINACDIDEVAVEIARENATLNGVSDRIIFSATSIDVATASADFVCANLTADVIVGLLPALLGVTCGRLVLSGILEVQLDMVLEKLRARGVANTIETIVDGEWVAVIV